MDHMTHAAAHYVRTRTLLKLISGVFLTILLIVMCSFTAHAQDYRKDNKRFYKSHFRKQASQYKNACGLLARKRQAKPRKVNARYNRSQESGGMVLASDINLKSKSAIVAKTDVTPKPAETPKREPKIEQISDEKLQQLHKNEDKVLAENKLPTPNSEQQAKVRKQVADKLASKTNVYPLVLAPLYFTFAQDEFSVVDMEPFLVAVEYALQGRTILIEGHTDSYGNDQYNMQLSIKRVQKIRQLMLDMGVPDERISIVGYGEQVKSNTNKTDEGRQLNRRVDFTVF